MVRTQLGLPNEGEYKEGMCLNWNFKVEKRDCISMTIEPCKVRIWFLVNTSWP